MAILAIPAESRPINPAKPVTGLRFVHPAKWLSFAKLNKRLAVSVLIIMFSFQDYFAAD